MTTRKKDELVPSGLLGGTEAENKPYSASGITQARVNLDPAQTSTSSKAPVSAPTYKQQTAASQNKLVFPEGATNHDKIQSMIDHIMNRDAFEYDFSQDPMYQMYADQYQRKGRLAMLDTMAQSAALTGGYGNTYAQQAGQQAYQRYMEDMMTNIVPQLRTQAYQTYQDELDGQRDDLNALQEEERMQREQDRWEAEFNLALQQAAAAASPSSRSSGGSRKRKAQKDDGEKEEIIYLPPGSAIGSSRSSVASVAAYRDRKNASPNMSAIGSSAASVAAVKALREKKNNKK